MMCVPTMGCRPKLLLSRIRRFRGGAYSSSLGRYCRGRVREGEAGNGGEGGRERGGEREGEREGEGGRGREGEREGEGGEGGRERGRERVREGRLLEHTLC